MDHLDPGARLVNMGYAMHRTALWSCACVCFVCVQWAQWIWRARAALWAPIMRRKDGMFSFLLSSLFASFISLRVTDGGLSHYIDFSSAAVGRLGLRLSPM